MIGDRTMNEHSNTENTTTQAKNLNPYPSSPTGEGQMRVPLGVKPSSGGGIRTVYLVVIIALLALILAVNSVSLVTQFLAPATNRAFNLDTIPQGSFNFDGAGPSTTDTNRSTTY
jgi:hypothetical protein